MKFKEFSEWCNDRACDGAWCMQDAYACICILNEVMHSSNKKKEQEKKFQEIAIKYDIIKGINEFNKKFGLDKVYPETEPEPVSLIQRIKDWFAGHGRK